MAFRRRRIRIRKKRPKETVFWRHVLYGFCAIAAVILICAGLWYVTRLPALTITEVTVTGGETLSHESMRHIAETELRGNYFLIIPHRFTYLYPHEKILGNLLNVPKVRTASLAKEGRSELRITFEEYIPHALWCSDADKGDCYFISEEGYAYAPAPRLEGSAFLTHVFEGESELTEKQLIEPAALAEIDAFVEALQDKLGFRIGEITHTKSGDLHYLVNGGGEFLAAGTMTATQTFENLKSVLDSEAFAHIRPGNFRYIDLRFGNKVFVNEDLEAETAASATNENPQ